MKMPSVPADRALVTPADGQVTNSYWMFFGSIAKTLRDGSGLFTVGTHAQRVTKATRGFVAVDSVPLGGLFIETDRGNVVYQTRLVNKAVVWVYLSGRLECLQANLPADLAANDAGLLASVTDYGHVLKWSGSAWSWGPGEQGSGMMALFEVNPTATGWHLYDGSTVSYLKADGTLGSVALPDLVSATANAAYPKAGSPNSGPNAATGATISGGTVASAATGITGSTAATGSTTSVNNGTGTLVTLPTSAHTHAVTITDPHHTHTLSAITAGTDGEPRNLVRRPYFRQ